VQRSALTERCERHLFRQHRDLGFGKRVVGPGGKDIVDELFRAVMLDIGLLQEIVVDLALERR